MSSKIKCCPHINEYIYFMCKKSLIVALVIMNKYVNEDIILKLSIEHFQVHVNKNLHCL